MYNSLHKVKAKNKHNDLDTGQTIYQSNRMFSHFNLFNLSFQMNMCSVFIQVIAISKDSCGHTTITLHKMKY